MELISVDLTFCSSSSCSRTPDTSKIYTSFIRSNLTFISIVLNYLQLLPPANRSMQFEEVRDIAIGSSQVAIVTTYKEDGGYTIQHNQGVLLFLMVHFPKT